MDSTASKTAEPRMWLQDALPQDAPKCRIFTSGYKSEIFDERTHPRLELSNQADRLSATLSNIRNKLDVSTPGTRRLLLDQDIPN